MHAIYKLAQSINGTDLTEKAFVMPSDYELMTMACEKMAVDSVVCLSDEDLHYLPDLQLFDMFRKALLGCSVEPKLDEHNKLGSVIPLSQVQCKGINKVLNELYKRTQANRVRP